MNIVNTWFFGINNDHIEVQECGQNICSINDLTDKEDAIRYARLITAAPVMLRALRGVGYAIERNGSARKDFAHILQMIDDTIAVATGEDNE